MTPELVRGIDYYERTAWEWVVPGGGAQAGTISGGGRYDGLAEQIGGKRVPGVGFGCGTERVVLALEEAGVEPPLPVVDWFAACDDAAARPALHGLAERRAQSRPRLSGRPRGAQPQGPAPPRGAPARARGHGLPRRRRRAWHRQARRDRDRVRRCRGLRRAERAGAVSAYRDMLCGEPRAEHAGRELTLSGWVGGRRDHGGLVFIDLRDRTGIVQLVMDPDRSPEAHATAQALRLECVVRARGKLVPRSEATRNDQLPTGAVELAVESLELLSSSEVLPFQLDDENVDEALRIRHRYLDLRRPRMQDLQGIRTRAVRSIRRFLDERGFLDIETPTMTRATPEGARDFVIPFRLEPGTFYALPQSPQLYKQLLMCGGFDRYYQIARCWRDEAQRADRALEFTQLDLEMSFVEQEDVLTLTEQLMAEVWRDAGHEIELPFPRMPYGEALARYGSDKPDLRYGLEIGDVSAQVGGLGVRRLLARRRAPVASCAA